MENKHLSIFYNDLVFYQERKCFFVTLQVNVIMTTIFNFYTTTTRIGLPTSDELTDEAIVEAILHPELEPEEILEDHEEIPAEPETIFTLKESIENSAKLLRTLMRQPGFDSTDSLYFTSLIDRLKKKEHETRKQTQIGKFFRRIWMWYM